VGWRRCRTICISCRHLVRTSFARLARFLSFRGAHVVWKSWHYLFSQVPPRACLYHGTTLTVTRPLYASALFPSPLFAGGRTGAPVWTAVSSDNFVTSRTLRRTALHVLGIRPMRRYVASTPYTCHVLHRATNIPASFARYTCHDSRSTRPLPSVIRPNSSMLRMHGESHSFFTAEPNSIPLACLLCSTRFHLSPAE